MTRPQKIGLGCFGLLVLAAGIVFIGGMFLTGDLRQRRALLRPLLATNASLSVLTNRAGYFTIYRRGTLDWEQTLSRYKNGSKWDQHIAEKIERAAAVGHSSTIEMQTWIFLDDHDRLIDFDLGSQ